MANLQPIKCCNPRLITNTHFRDMMLSFRCYHTPDGFCTVSNLEVVAWTKEFPYRRFMKNVDRFNLDEYFFCNPCTGECFPMYYLVGCGKCELCREDRANEWCFRAHCESSVSDTIPLFCTFTYAEDPPEGVVKKHVQDFLKRFRIRLHRNYSLEMSKIKSLRYFFVAEYGTDPYKTHRPHYHAIIWNMPYLDEHMLLSDRMTRDLLIDCWGHGFVKTLPLLSGGTSYVCKYMRKDCPVPPGKNETFMLCSRRPGLGSEVCDKLTDFLRENWQETQVSVYDRYTNSTFTYKLPDYFRTRIFPRLSELIPKFVRDAFRVLNDTWYQLRALDWDSSEKTTMYKIVQTMRQKFEMLPYFSRPDYPILNQTIKPSQGKEKMVNINQEHLNRLVNNFKSAYVILYSYDPDYEFINQILWLSSARKSYQQMLPRELYDTGYLLTKLREKRAKDLQQRLF